MPTADTADTADHDIGAETRRAGDGLCSADEIEAPLRAGNDWSLSVAGALLIGVVVTWPTLTDAVSGATSVVGAAMRLLAVTTVALLGFTFVASLHHVFTARARHAADVAEQGPAAEGVRA